MSTSPASSTNSPTGGEADVPIEGAEAGRLLVVDDNRVNRLLLGRTLEQQGHSVAFAADGRRALEMLAKERFDLVLLDVEMPELDGLAATRKIRQLKNLAGVPIVAVSAYGADQYREHALEAGCNEYVSTPFEPDELERVIRSLIK